MNRIHLCVNSICHTWRCTQKCLVIWRQFVSYFTSSSTIHLWWFGLQILQRRIFDCWIRPQWPAKSGPTRGPLGSQREWGGLQVVPLFEVPRWTRKSKRLHQSKLIVFGTYYMFLHVEKIAPITWSRGNPQSSRFHFISLHWLIWMSVERY